MDRRAFLSGSAAALAAGCAAGAPPPVSAAELRDRIATLDHTLATIRGTPPGAIATGMPWHLRPELGERILRESIEALAVYDAAHGLPPGAGLPDALAARVREEGPLVARALATHHALLSRMPPAIRRNVGQRLRDRPAVAQGTSEWLDRHAAAVGVSRASRLRLRNETTAILARMRRQSTSAVIDGATSKVEDVLARSGAELALARSAAGTAMIDAIWQQIDGGPSRGASGLVPPGAYQGEGAIEGEGGSAQGVYEPDPEVPEGRWNARWGRPGDEEVQIGAIMMAFFCPSGGTLLIAGLIVLIAGCVQNDEWNGESEEQRRAREAREG